MEDIEWFVYDPSSAYFNKDRMTGKYLELIWAVDRRSGTMGVWKT
jgi:hypothetical protein